MSDDGWDEGRLWNTYMAIIFAVCGTRAAILVWSLDPLLAVFVGAAMGLHVNEYVGKAYRQWRAHLSPTHKEGT